MLTAVAVEEDESQEPVIPALPGVWPSMGIGKLTHSKSIFI